MFGGDNVPRRYVPKSLTTKDTKIVKTELNKSRKKYKQGIYYTRKKVKSYKPNSYGLYDMCGNVWEWVHTKYGIRGDKRILMGGGFYTSNVYMRKGRYGRDDATLCSHNVGFRICQGSLLK